MGLERNPSDEKLLEEQKQYYRERAPEYDDWWYRRGRYDLGDEHRSVWESDQDVLKQRLELFLPARSLLELAATVLPHLADAVGAGGGRRGEL